MSSEEITVSDGEWEGFKKLHKKTYKDEEEEKMRRNIYLETKKKVTLHNKKYESGQVTFKQGINQFADLTHEEFKNRTCGYRPID